MSLLKKAGSTVVEYFKWDLPKVLNQGGTELLKYANNQKVLFGTWCSWVRQNSVSKKFQLEPDADQYDKDSKPLHDLILGT